MFLSEPISTGYQSGTFVIAFYDAGGNAVTPTAGTIKPEMSPIKVNGMRHLEVMQLLMRPNA